MIKYWIIHENRWWIFLTDMSLVSQGEGELWYFVNVSQKTSFESSLEWIVWETKEVLIIFGNRLLNWRNNKESDWDASTAVASSMANLFWFVISVAKDTRISPSHASRNRRHQHRHSQSSRHNILANHGHSWLTLTTWDTLIILYI